MTLQVIFKVDDDENQDELLDNLAALGGWDIEIETVPDEPPPIKGTRKKKSKPLQRGSE